MRGVELRSVINRVVASWKVDGVHMLPPGCSHELIAAAEAIGIVLSDSSPLVSLYRITGGMQSWECDENMFHLWDTPTVVAQLRSGVSNLQKLTIADVGVGIAIFQVDLNEPEICPIHIKRSWEDQPILISNSLLEFFSDFSSGLIGDIFP